MHSQPRRGARSRRGFGGENQSSVVSTAVHWGLGLPTGQGDARAGWRLCGTVRQNYRPPRAGRGLQDHLVLISGKEMEAQLSGVT